MKTILFITGNTHKVSEARSVLEPLGVHVATKDLDIVEIQAHDPLQIAIAKAKSAYNQVDRAVVVCDHTWSFHALNGFPGGYMKDMNSWFEAEDFLALMQGRSDRSVTLTETVVYVEGDHLEHFSVDFRGRVLEEPRGKGYVACERIVVFDGHSKTIAEYADAGEHALGMTRSAWREFGQWYVAV